MTKKQVRAALDSAFSAHVTTLYVTAAIGISGGFKDTEGRFDRGLESALSAFAMATTLIDKLILPEE